MTQPIYSDADVERIADLKKSVQVRRIIGGIMPLVRKNALFITNQMRGHVPQEVLDHYEEGMSREEYEEVAICVSVEMRKN